MRPLRALELQAFFDIVALPRPPVPEAPRLGISSVELQRAPTTRQNIVPASELTEWSLHLYGSALLHYHQCFARASRPAFCQPGRGALLGKPCTDRYYLVTASEGNPDVRKLRNYQYKATDTYISSKIYSSFSYIFCYVIQLLRCISNVI